MRANVFLQLPSIAKSARKFPQVVFTPMTFLLQSNMTSNAWHGCNTQTPHFCARLRRMLSSVARQAWYPSQGPFSSSPKVISLRLLLFLSSSFPLFHIVHMPLCRIKFAAWISSFIPSLSKRGSTPGCKVSPGLLRGNFIDSINVTLRPNFAAR